MEHSYVYKPSNYNRVINNPRFVSHVSDRIATILDRKITVNEKHYVKNFISKLNPAIFKGKGLQNISDTLSSMIAGKIKKHTCEEPYVNMREYTRREIGISGESDALVFESPSGETPSYSQTPVSLGTSVNISSIIGATSAHGVQQLLNPIALHKNNYFILDSRYRILDNDGTKYLAWNHVNNVTRAQGTVNTVGVLRDIIEMKVYPIRLPYTGSAENDFKRVTMLVEEFSAQSFIGQENRRFHFVFDVEVDGDWIRLNPYFHNNGIFKFNKPITQFDTVKISFGSPLDNITLDTDRLNASNTYESTASLTTVNDHNLSSGNSIVISEFNTNSPINDAVVITLMNTTHIITVTGADTFTIPVDTSSIINSELSGNMGVTNGVNTVVGTGTSFLTELKVNDIVKIKSVSYTISAITDDLNLTLSNNYAGITETLNSDLTGTSVDVTQGSPTVEGDTTSFDTELSAGDVIRIVGVAYTIQSVTDADTLVLTTNYTGTTNAAAPMPQIISEFVKDNSIDGLSHSVFFNSKRLFVPMELTYVSPYE